MWCADLFGVVAAKVGGSALDSLALVSRAWRAWHVAETSRQVSRFMELISVHHQLEGSFELADETDPEESDNVRRIRLGKSVVHTTRDIVLPADVLTRVSDDKWWYPLSHRHQHVSLIGPDAQIMRLSCRQVDNLGDECPVSLCVYGYVHLELRGQPPFRVRYRGHCLHWSSTTASCGPILYAGGYVYDTRTRDGHLAARRALKKEHARVGRGEIAKLIGNVR